MKRFAFILSVSIVLVLNETTFAQRASDYYLPLRVDNYLQFQSSDRATTYSIIQSDSISGHLYFLEKRSETMVGSGVTNVYALFWLRKDTAGEILMGAMGVTGSIDGSWSANLDSATIFNPPGPFFSGQFLVPGYSYGYTMEGYSWADTTMSNTESVQTNAGTFVNCVKIRETKRRISPDSLIYVEYTYYAPGKGVVKIARDGWPQSTLVAYKTTTAVEPKNVSSVPAAFSLNQNYPNPFNPTTTIRFNVPERSKVRLQVFNVLGQQVAELMNEEVNAGSAQKVWNASSVPSGVYFCRMTAGSYTGMKKLVLVR